MRLSLAPLVALLCVTLGGPAAEGALVHRYTFNDGTANDSVGSANGTLQGTASIGGLGRLTLTGGGAGNSYVNLPNGIATSAVASGMAGAFSFEVWARSLTNQNWAGLVSFGGADGLEDSNDGANKDYIQLIPRNGATQSIRATTHAIANGTEGFVDFSAPLSTSVDQHMVVVVNQSGGLPGTIDFYVGGNHIGQSPVATGLDIATMTDNNNWLGRSQWGDASFNGSYDELRIYDHALNATEVSDSFATGPTPPPSVPLTPTLTVNRNTGALMLQGGQTANQVVGYSLQSAFGSLNQTAWTPITDRLDAPSPGNGSFDNDDQWTKLTAAGSHTDLSEFEFDGGNGGNLGVGAFLSLGNAGTWIKSPVEDLQMELKLDNGQTVQVSVNYTGNGGQSFSRSDLDFNGVINELDWPVFRGGSHSDLSTLSQAEAYGLGDLDGDGDNDYSDFVLFRNDFDAANGVGAFAAMLSSIPEPSSLVLLVGIGCCCIASRRGGTRTCNTSRWGTSAMDIRLGTPLRTTAALALAFATLQPLNAALVNKYTFNDGTANDSVGSANGTLQGTAAINGVNGRLTLTGGGAGNSYVNLPNGIATSAVNSGTTGAFSFEVWARSLQNAGWASLVSFGGATGQEDTNEGAMKDYIQLIPQNGAATQTIRATTHAINVGAEGFVDYTAPLSTAADQQMVIVVNQNGGLPGTIDLYVDGSHVGQSPVAAGLDISTMVDNNNWLGRSQWGDQSFNGSYDELRIYDHALTAQEVMDRFAVGPDPSPLLTLVVNKVTGQTSIRNDAAVPLDFEYYEITSEGGALSLAGWNSLSDQNIDAIDGSDPDSIVGNVGTETWEEAGGANNFLLSELFVQAGSTLSPGASLSLGSAFNPSIFGSGNDGDLKFSFGSINGSSLTKSTVEYITGSTVAGDFDGDGDVDGADFLRWQRNPSVGNLADWKLNYGADAVAATTAIPEPFTLGLIAVGTLLGLAVRRRPALLVLLASYAAISMASTASASLTLDRLYHFGEDDISAAPNGVVGNGFIDPNTGYPATFDSVGSSGAGNYQDLFTKTDVAGNDPRYVAPGNAKLPGSTLAAMFSGDDFLYGRRLGLPSSSDPAVDDPANGDDTDLLAPEDYSGISNRGFDVWVKPTASGSLQSVVMDTNQHGLQITAAGTWSMRYNNNNFDSGVTAALNQWSHLVLVRPDASGSRLYLNGIAIAAATGGYDGGANARLVVGANTTNDDTTLGMSDFFTGVVDELGLFVLGTNNGTPATDYGTFNPGEDISEIAAALAGKPQGDLNLDGNVNSTDVNIFVSHWLTNPKVINNLAVADLDTYKLGDLNFSGRVDIDDAFLLHEGLQLAGSVGLDFSLLTSVPEPGTFVLMCGASLALLTRRK